MDDVERRKRFLVTVSDTLRNLVDIVESDRCNTAATGNN